MFCKSIIILIYAINIFAWLFTYYEEQLSDDNALISSGLCNVCISSDNSGECGYACAFWVMNVRVYSCMCIYTYIYNYLCDLGTVCAYVPYATTLQHKYVCMFLDVEMFVALYIHRKYIWTYVTSANLTI